MGATYYYEGELPFCDKEGTRKFELFVSDFFGTHELYLRIDDDVEKTVRLDKRQARKLLEGLEGAMIYLSYLS